MKFNETPLAGAFVIELEKKWDQRGFFARAWCQKEFGEHGLSSPFVQVNSGFSHLAGTLRGMHYQVAPKAEVKVVRCTRGRVFDVVVDLRAESETFGSWFGAELTADSGTMLYVPEGFAHGYQTLEDNVEIFYQTSQFFAPDLARGVRYNDPAFGIRWPLAVSVISDADSHWPDFRRP